MHIAHAADPEAHFHEVAVDMRVYLNNIIAANGTVNNIASCLQMCM